MSPMSVSFRGPLKYPRSSLLVRYLLASSSSQFVHHVRMIESTSLASATVRSNLRTKATCGPLPDLNHVFEVLSNLDVDLPQGRSRPSFEERVRCVPACTSKPRRHRPTNIATDT